MTKTVWHLIVYFYLHNFYYFNMCIFAKKIKVYAVLLKCMLIHIGSFSMYWGVLLAAEEQCNCSMYSNIYKNCYKNVSVYLVIQTTFIYP